MYAPKYSTQKKNSTLTSDDSHFFTTAESSDFPSEVTVLKIQIKSGCTMYMFFGKSKAGKEVQNIVDLSNKKLRRAAIMQQLRARSTLISNSISNMIKTGTRHEKKDLDFRVESDKVKLIESHSMQELFTK